MSPLPLLLSQPGGKGEEEIQACWSLWRSLQSPTQILPGPAPGSCLLQFFPVKGWETDISGKRSESQRPPFHLSASWVRSFSSLPLPFFDLHSLFPSLINFLFLYQSPSVIFFSPLHSNPPPFFFGKLCAQELELTIPKSKGSMLYRLLYRQSGSPAAPRTPYPP